MHNVSYSDSYLPRVKAALTFPGNVKVSASANGWMTVKNFITGKEGCGRSLMRKGFWSLTTTVLI